ncbi:MAG: helix-turn-helix domain-containing protein [Porcipelethomonas sp.]
MTLGERFKYVRKYNNLNQSNFAKVLGISQTHVSKIEKDVEKPSETLLRFVSYMFVINLEWLKTGAGDPHHIDTDYKSQFDKTRQKLELLLRYMDDETALNFLDSFAYFTFINEIFENEKKTSQTDCGKSFRNILKNLWILTIHAKETNDNHCGNQIDLLNASIEEFIKIITSK